MAGIIRNMRTTYATEQLPLELAKTVVAKAEEFVAFLEQEKVMTAPEVRAMVNPILPQINILKGQIMAAEIQAAGGGEDEMDVWERNGIRAKQ